MKSCSAILKFLTEKNLTEFDPEFENWILVIFDPPPFYRSHRNLNQ